MVRSVHKPVPLYKQNQEYESNTNAGDKTASSVSSSVSSSGSDGNGMASLYTWRRRMAHSSVICGDLSSLYLANRCLIFLYDERFSVATKMDA
mmetsp:Transcript_17238/g.31004  ORF Transcript_17238/g.31004 Transcript_17238/m.31004 type:complete len:93 (-) Transcript_17238:789-1067(-)